jgi:amino acid transporter
VLWAYDGWADLSYAAGEVKDPQRNLPRAFILGTLAVIAIYVLANIAYLSVLSIEEIRTSLPELGFVFGLETGEEPGAPKRPSV